MLNLVTYISLRPPYPLFSLQLRPCSAGVHSPTQFDALEPVQNEECALNTTEFAQRDGEPVLTWIAAEFVQRSQKVALSAVR
jgi:hypothetical protein